MPLSHGGNDGSIPSEPTAIILALREAGLYHQNVGTYAQLFPKTCEVCLKEFQVPRHMLKRRRHCSKRCFADSQRTSIELVCSNARCGKKFARSPSKVKNSRSGVSFCSAKCKAEGQCIGGVKAVQPAHYGTAKVPRTRLIRTRGRRCEGCRRTRWMGHPIPLEVDHIDGDRNNNEEGNFRLLCPNCHALTPTWKGRNSRRYACEGPLGTALALQAG